MINAIDLFSELGRRLACFGEDAATREVIRRACDANGWFTEHDIQRAVGAIADHMLRREQLAAWLAHYPSLPVADPKQVLVIMAGNIPLVGFFDLLCVVASGHRCRIKPSAKDRVLMEYVAAQLHAIDPEVDLVCVDDTFVPDAVIATGSDNANHYFKTRFAGIPALLRGNRQSVAVLSGTETATQLAALADDIWAYSGLGCRNVSLVFLPEGMQPALQMPAMNPKFQNNYRQGRALLAMSGTPFTDLGDAVAVEERAFPLALCQLNYTYYRTLGEVEAWLAEHDSELQCVVTECVDHGRRVDFGAAQSPKLTDYADNRDVMQFLSKLG